MRPFKIVLAIAFFVARAAFAEPVTLRAADGATVHGQYWPAAGRNAPLIVAFHQAGSNHAEYTPLAPRLNRRGFGVLAIDQRSGGDEFGAVNRTVAALGRSDTYEAALPDLEAALAWGVRRAGGAPVLVWGSSYSAALAFVLAARHPADVAGVLAFSPGEYLDDEEAVGRAAQDVRVPVFIDQSSGRDEIAQSRAIFDALPGADKTLFVPKLAVHGSSTLRDDRNRAGAEENWRAVERFLSKFGAK